MKLPADAHERRILYADLVRQCTASRPRRFELNRVLRNYFLFGTPDTSGATYNRIEETIDTLKAFIYAADATRFTLKLGTTATDDDLAKVPLLVEETNDQWRASKTHVLFGMAVDWSLVYGSMLLKVLWGGRAGRAQTFLVEPHQFGVLREDIVNLEDQEAFVHCYTMTKTQLESELEGNPRKTEILAGLSRTGETDGPGLYADGLQRLVLSAGIATTAPTTASGGTMEGGITGAATASYDYVPEVTAELVDMFELYVWNDEIDDYQMVTIASPDVVVYDRPQVGVPGIPSFVKLAPDPRCYDYFWGATFIAKLVRLQDWREDNIVDMRELLKKNIDPPLAFSGMAGIAEEKLLAMRTRGGVVSLGPNGKADALRPQIPSEIFHIEQSIDAMYDAAAGISHVMQGKGASGVRSKGQADLLARLGSARPKSRSMMVEEAAADVATLILRYVQQHSTQRYQVKPAGFIRNPFRKPLTFIAEQFTKDYEVVVDAHSSSPVFMEDRKNDAMTLFEAGAIDRETLLEMFDAPSLQVLKEKLKALEAKREEQAKLEAMQGVKR